MGIELERQLAELRAGDHLCMIYEDAAEQMAAIVPFVREGLARGECCAYISDDRSAEEVVEALAAAGVDVPRERERGALLLLTKRDTYLRGGQFDPDQMLDFLRKTIEEALAAGFSAFRATGEMAWALGPEPGCDRVMEYETRLNEFFPGSRALAVCQYNRRRFAPDVIRDVLRTHPVAILGRQVCPNLYYEPPDLVLGDAPVARRVDWMTGQLQRLHADAMALRESEERFRRLADASFEGIVVHDHGMILEASQTLAQMVGYELSELTGMSVLDLVAPAYRPLVQQRIAAGFEEPYDSLNLRKDGTTFAVEILGKALPYRGRNARVAVVRDITSRKRAEETLAARTRQLEAARAVAAEITRELDLAVLLGLLHRRAAELVGAVAGTVYLWDEAAQRLILRAWHGYGDWMRDISTRLGEGFSGTVAQRREGMILNEYRTSPLANPILLERTQITAALAEPLLYRDRLLGVLTLNNESGQPFTQADQELLALFAAQAAIAIENARLYEESQRSAREATALAEVGRDLATSLDPDRVLGLIVQEVQRLMEAPFVGLALLDPEREELAFAKGAGLSPDRMSRLRLKVGEGIAGRAVAQRGPMQSSNILEDPRYVAMGFGEVEGFRSLLCVPLLAAGRPLGAIVVFRQDEHEFTPAEVELLARFADQAAIAIENARLFREEQERRRQLEAVRAVTAEITRELDLDTVLSLVNRRATDLLRAPAGWLWLWDEKDQVLAPRAWQGLGEWVRGERRRLGEGITGIVALRREGLIVNDVRVSPHVDPAILERVGFAAVVAEPLLYRERLIGVIVVDRFEGEGPFTEQDRELLALFAAQAAIAIENARLYEESQRRAREATALAEVGKLLSGSLDLDHVLEVIVQEVRRILDVPFAGVLMLDHGTQELSYAKQAGLGTQMDGVRLKVGEGMAGEALRRGAPVQSSNVLADARFVSKDLARSLEFRSVLCAPLLAEGLPLGVLVVFRGEEYEFPAAEVELLLRFADQATLAIANARLYKEVREARDALRALSHRLVEIQEAERRNVARELHDEIGQLLTGLKLSLERGAHGGADLEGAGLEKARLLVNDLIQRVREMSLDLRPSMLDDLGLLPALLWQFERYTTQTGVGVTFQHAGVERRFRLEIEMAAFRIAQEALTNVARHAGVGEVAVRIWADEDVLHVQVEDGGRGFDPASVGTRSSGLTGMGERAALLGGLLAVESRPGGGTRVAADLPLAGGIPPGPENA